MHVGPRIMFGLLKSAVLYFDDPLQLEDFDAFVVKHKKEFSEKDIKTAHHIILSNIRWMQIHRSTVVDWFSTFVY